MNKTFGYVRVSSKEQNEERQVKALLEKELKSNISLWIKKVAKILIEANINY